ncbi:MAG: hypothetical protein E6G04_04505 [Actinobacteria bacterium]|nr:MAG: hypothetical protein E6G04_04505 [Actinomycetota bacterium]
MAESVGAHACIRCGNAVPEGSRFCPACGAAQTQAPREERRVVTVLFGDLSGFTELSEARDAEEVKAIIDRAFERITDIVERYGGHVDKIIGDEVMAVFGAPQAHEDDAERAVRAALVIQRVLEEDSAELERERGIPLRMHIGLNTGEVVAGFVGGSDSYTVLGDAVNTARRIGDAADAGQILVGVATEEATRDAIEYRRIGQVTAKGKRVPVQVWEALAELGLPGERAIRTAPLIGREEELGMLDSLARIVRRDRRTMSATIVGEAGMGKSRLADEFARRISAQGVRVLNGRSLPYGTASPAFSIEEMVRAALVVDPTSDPEAAAACVRDRLDAHGLAAEADRLLAFLGLGGAIPSRDGAPGSAPATSQPSTSPLLESAMAVLERIAEAEGMLVLAFHELHWAEDAVLDFIQKMLGASRAPLLILCLSRLELLERRPDWSVGVGSATIPMGPLPRDRAVEMLEALAPTLPHSLRESVVERAGGNPFYLEELARLLVARGPEKSGVPVPGSIQSLVAARLDALPPASKRLLQDAAVVGAELWPGALGVLGVENAADLLEAQEVRELIERSDATLLPGQVGYRFRQALVRDVAYNSVPKNVRAQQHAAVGTWLEDVCREAGKEREFDDLIAHHFERAALLARDVGGADEDAEAKARVYLERAGDQSHDMDAAQTAAGFYERALAFAGDDADRTTLRIRLAEALVGSWQHEAAMDHLDQALTDARGMGDRAAEGKALRLRGDSLRRALVCLAAVVPSGARALPRSAGPPRRRLEPAEPRVGRDAHGASRRRVRLPVRGRERLHRARRRRGVRLVQRDARVGAAAARRGDGSRCPRRRAGASPDDRASRVSAERRLRLGAHADPARVRRGRAREPHVGGDHRARDARGGRLALREHGLGASDRPVPVVRSRVVAVRHRRGARACRGRYALGRVLRRSVLPRSVPVRAVAARVRRRQHRRSRVVGAGDPRCG